MNDASIIINRIGAVLRAEKRRLASDLEVPFVHLEILLYLHEANEYSNTPAAVVEYLGITKGTLSQSLKVMDGRGLIAKVDDAQNKKVVRLVLAERGREVIDVVKRRMDILLDGVDGAENLEQLLGTMQRNSGFKSFGVCKSCKYHNPLDGRFFLCGLTQEKLVQAEGERICREHELEGAV